MSIVATLLDTGFDTTDGASFATASITPVAERLTILAVCGANGSAPATPSSVTGCGLTWALYATVDFVTDNKRLCLYRACGASPSTGAVSITYSGSQTGFAWSVVSVAGANIDLANNGLNSIRQGRTGAADAVTSLTLTFVSAFSSSNNGGLAFFVTDLNNAMTPDGSWTEFASGDVGGTVPAMRIETQWVASAVSAASASFPSADCAGIAIEIHIPRSDNKVTRGVARGTARGVA